MSNKVVLITGGSSGIGKATGIYLRQKGFIVYGTTRSLLKHADFKHFSLLELDVSDEKSIKKTINTIIEKEGKLDILINNAGVGITGPVEETPINEIEKAFDTNLNGPIRMIQAALPEMRKKNSGLVINITSIAGYMGLPYRGIYSATKGALELVTEALRMEAKEFGVNITNLAPGDFATNIAAGRFHSPVSNNSPYKAYGRTLELINEDVSNASDPIKVAQKILKIINTNQPKVHYRVGSFTQKFSLILKKLLPDKVYERLLLKHYKL